MSNSIGFEGKIFQPPEANADAIIRAFFQKNDAILDKFFDLNFCLKTRF